MNNKRQFEQDLKDIIELSTKFLEYIQKDYPYDIHISYVNRTATMLNMLLSTMNDFNYKE